jgi:hypothetical protein
MRFNTPGKKPVEFEIEDDWLNEAGMHEFNPSARSYCPLQKNFSKIISLPDIKPPTFPGRVFDRDRTISILNAFKTDSPLPAIEVVKTDNPDYDYEVRHGFHRFYTSVAAGFTAIPVWIRSDL